MYRYKHDTSGQDKVGKGMQNWRGKECRVKNHWRAGQRIGIEFNLLWLEFQNTRWLMHIAFGAAPSRLCSRIYPPFPSPSLVYHHRISSLPNSPLCVPLYQPRYHLFAANVNSFCHALSGAKHHTPPDLPQLLCLPIYLYLYFCHFSFSRLKRYLCHTNWISPLYALAYRSILPPSAEYHPSYSRLVAVSMTMA